MLNSGWLLNTGWLLNPPLDEQGIKILIRKTEEVSNPFKDTDHNIKFSHALVGRSLRYRVAIAGLGSTSLEVFHQKKKNTILLQILVI